MRPGFTIPKGVRNLQFSQRKSEQLGREANAAMELSYYRGYMAGYMMAMEDHKNKKIKRDYAMQPNRAENKDFHI